MRANRRRDTTPELAIRRLLHRHGLRYRVDFPLPFDRRRKADIAFTREKMAIFVDGCFWHGCPQHYVPPRANPDYWAAKVESNRRRDQDSAERLAADGWRVLRFWEHESPTDVVSRIEQALGSAPHAGAGIEP